MAGGSSGRTGEPPLQHGPRLLHIVTNGKEVIRVVRINLQLGFNDVEQADANVAIPPHGQESADVFVLFSAERDGA